MKTELGSTNRRYCSTWNIYINSSQTVTGTGLAKDKHLAIDINKRKDRYQ